MAGVLLPLTVLGGLAIIAVIVAVSLRMSGVWRPSPAVGPRGRDKRRPKSKGSRRLFSRRRRRVLRRGLALAGLLVLVGIIYEGATLAIASNRLLEGSTILAESRKALGDDPVNWTEPRIASARELQRVAAEKLNGADADFSHDLLLRALSKVPWARDQARAVVDLAHLASAAAGADKDLLAVADAVLELRTSKLTAGPRVLRLIERTGPPAEHASATLEGPTAQVRADLSKPVVSQLRNRGNAALAALEPLAARARVLAAAGKFAPHALGSESPQTYLVLLPNPSELRPAGGFSGAIGTVTMTDGAPSAISVKNQELYNPLITKKVDPPYPLSRYLKFFKNSLELGDAGWDPDFPSTAKVSEEIFASVSDRKAALPVEGTISIDPYAIAALLEVTGPVDAAQYGQFDSANFFTKLNFIVNVSDAPGAGKGALGPISEAVLRKILEAPAALWPRMMEVAEKQALGRHVQAAVHDPGLAGAIGQVHYDGAIVETQGDYLMVTDANVGITKGDVFVKKSMAVKSDVLTEGIVHHELTLRYAMPLPQDDTDRKLNPGDGSYRDYVRFYLPEAASVAGFKIVGNGQGGLDKISVEHGRQVVGIYFRLARGQDTELQLQYEVPRNPDDGYQLYLQKQAGEANLPTELTVSYPGGLRRQRTDLAADMTYSVAW